MPRRVTRVGNISDSSAVFVFREIFNLKSVASLASLIVGVLALAQVVGIWDPFKITESDEATPVATPIPVVPTPTPRIPTPTVTRIPPETPVAGDLQSLINDLDARLGRLETWRAEAESKIQETIAQIEPLAKDRSDIDALRNILKDDLERVADIIFLSRDLQELERQIAIANNNASNARDESRFLFALIIAAIGLLGGIPWIVGFASRIRERREPDVQAESPNQKPINPVQSGEKK